MKKLLLLSGFLLTSLFVQSQEQETPAPSFIRSIVFSATDADFGTTPIVQLGDRLRLQFDDIIGDEADYYYSIEHFNYDWTHSSLIKSEYLDGFDNLRIDTYENSFNTLQLYTHYELEIPNIDTQGFKVSGNYMLHISNDEGETVFSRKFMVYESLAQVQVSVVRPREVNNIPYKQTVHFSVHPEEFIIRNPGQNVKTLLLQNNQLTSAITGLAPQYTAGNDLIYRYDAPSSFWAGNEYLAFDSKDLRAATSSIERIEVHDLYHHYLFPSRVRATFPYTYNPDINGNFLITTSQGNNNHTEAEYVWTHFSLDSPEITDAEVHIYGGFNNFHQDQSTLLTYNPLTNRYEGARLFKQGFYNYKYVLLRADGTLDEGYFSGNFEQTENQYTVLIYYREPGGRYDRIIGMGTANSASTGLD